MALNNLQIKVYPETELDFNTLMAESESSTKGKFLELLIENFKNPKIKTVFTDSPEIVNKVKDLQDQVNELLTDQESINYHSEMDLNELATYRNTFNDIKTVFEPYLRICKRDKLADSYGDMFKLMLDILQSIPVKGPRLFVLTTDDAHYLKNTPVE